MSCADREPVEAQHAASLPRGLTAASSTSRPSSTVPRSLRSSCDICAASKIGCTKEKPACARCAKRGLACKYSPTKRPGRPQPDRQLASTAAAPSAATKSARAATTRYLLTPNPSSSSSVGIECDVPQSGTSGIPVSHSHDERQDTFATTDALLAPASILPDATPSYSDLELTQICTFGLDPTGFDMDLDPGGYEYWNSPTLMLPSTAVDTQDTDFENTFSSTSAGRESQEPWSNSTQPPAQEGALTHEGPQTGQIDPALENPSSFSTSPITSRGVCPSTHKDMSRSGCSYSSLAMGLMLQPSPQQSAKQGTLQTSTTVQAILLRTEANIDKVTNMLRASCVSDAYVIVILAMNTFKILDWFDAAASLESWRDDHLPDPYGMGLSPDADDGEDAGLLAAQKILSKLHRVQSLVSLLSERIHILVTTATQHDGDTRSRSGNVVRRSLGDLEALDTPLPMFGFFRKLESDLRARTRNLAQSVIKRM
nr:aflatoxin biosynthesis regulatory protein [Quercus suber]